MATKPKLIFSIGCILAIGTAPFAALGKNDGTLIWYQVGIKPQIHCSLANQLTTLETWNLIGEPFEVVVPEGADCKAPALPVALMPASTKAPIVASRSSPATLAAWIATLVGEKDPPDTGDIVPIVPPGVGPYCDCPTTFEALLDRRLVPIFQSRQAEFSAKESFFVTVTD